MTSTDQVAPRFPMNPFRSLVREGATLTADPEVELDECDEKLPPLHAILVRKGVDLPFEQLARQMVGREGDPFAPGKHVIEVPTLGDEGRFSYTLMFLLEKSRAEALLKETSSDADIESILAGSVSLRSGGPEAVPIGYATLGGSFESQTAIRIQEYDPDDPEDRDPADPLGYRLSLHPSAFFLSSPFRGLGYGIVSAAALASPIIDEIVGIRDLCVALGVEAKLEIYSYFEVYSEGGEAAVDHFHGAFEAIQDTLSILAVAAGGLSITDIELDGGW